MKEIAVTLDADELSIVAEALGMLRRKERKELAKLGALMEEWGPDGAADLLDLEEVRNYERWRRERITRVTELRDRVRADAQFAEMAEIEAIREEME